MGEEVVNMFLTYQVVWDPVDGEILPEENPGRLI